MRRTLRKLVLAPYTIVSMNWAVVAGLYYFMWGSKDIWKATDSRRH